MLVGLKACRGNLSRLTSNDCAGRKVADAWPDVAPQAIGNLRGNAVKFSNRGGHVLIALKETPAMAVLRVRDDDAGIQRQTP
jgi:signal transduction histidine kinase